MPVFNPLAGMVSYWRLDEAANLTRKDVLHANDLTDVNANTASAAGKLGNAASFDGTTNRQLHAADATSLRVTGDKWWGGWVNLADVATRRTVFNKDDGGATREYLFELEQLNGKFLFGRGVAGGCQIVRSAGNAATGWTRFDCWYNSALHTMNLSINNGTPVVLDVSSAGSPVTGSAQPFEVGQFSAAVTGKFNGLIDELHISNHVPTADELTAVYNAGNGTTWPLVTHTEQNPAFVTNLQGEYVTTALGALARFAVGSATVGGTVTVTANVMGGTGEAGENWFLQAYLDGIPDPIHSTGQFLTQGSDPRTASGTFSINPATWNLGTPETEFRLALRRYVGGFYCDELWWVGTPAIVGEATVPHLDKQGGVRTTYDPARSMILRFMADGNPVDFSGGPDGDVRIPGILKAAGINAGLCTIMNLPESVASLGLDAASAASIATNTPTLAAALAAGLKIVWASDDWDRGTASRAAIAANAWMGTYADRNIANAKLYGLVLSFGPDEADDALGPDAGSNFPSRGVLHPVTVAQGIPMCLPGKFTTALEASGYADVIGRYFDLRDATYNSPAGYFSTGQMCRWMNSRLDGELLAAPNPSKPLIVLIQCGWRYTKQSDGNTYNPAGGDFLTVSSPPVAITAQIGLALTYGAVGFYLYGYGRPFLKTSRLAAPHGSDLELRPDGLGTLPDNWTAVSTALNAVAKWEKRLLAPLSATTALGPGFQQCYHNGNGGNRIYLAVNVTDFPKRAASFPLGPWRDGWLVSENSVTRLDPQTLFRTPVPPGNWFVLTD